MKALALLPLTLALLLTSVTPAGAVPVTFDFPHGGTAAILRAPACKIGFVFGVVHVAPGCLSPLFVEITLPAGDPTSLWGTLAYYPDGFSPGGAVGVSQDRRITDGGFERFALPPDLLNGDYYFALSLSSLEKGAELIVYSFTLEWPAGSGVPSTTAPPLETVPEPATLLLLGTSLGVAGWVARKRRGR